MIYSIKRHSYTKKNLVKRVTASCCRECWPAQGADVSKSVQHDEESEANLGDEEHANTLQDTDAHHHFWFPTLNHSWRWNGTTGWSPQWLSITFLRARRTRRATSAVRVSSSNRLAMTASVPDLTKIVQPTPTTKQPMNPFTRVPHPNVVASLTVCTQTVLWVLMPHWRL